MKLIVTADDFGRSPQINAAIVRAHRDGILTAASLMVTGDAFEEAVAIARQTPTLAVGLHVVLVDGSPALPSERVSRLVNAEGRFPDAPARLGMRYFFEPRARRQLAAELTAQFRRFAETGLKLAHVDGHQHMHVHPAVFPLLLPLAEQHGAAGIRLPRDDLRFALKYDRRHALIKIVWAVAFGLLSRHCMKLLNRRPLAVARRVYGLMQSGRMEEAYVTALLRHIEEDTAEIYFHPTAGPRLNELGPNPEELQTLLSPWVRAEIESRRMQLCAYPAISRGESG